MHPSRRPRVHWGFLSKCGFLRPFPQVIVVLVRDRDSLSCAVGQLFWITSGYPVRDGCVVCQPRTPEVYYAARAFRWTSIGRNGLFDLGGVGTSEAR